MKKIINYLVAGLIIPILFLAFIFIFFNSPVKKVETYELGDKDYDYVKIVMLDKISKDFATLIVDDEKMNMKEGDVQKIKKKKIGFVNIYSSVKVKEIKSRTVIVELYSEKYIIWGTLIIWISFFMFVSLILAIFIDVVSTFMMTNE